MFNRERTQRTQKGLRGAVSALRGLDGSRPECGGGRCFAKGFCAFAKALRAARLGGYAVLLWMKGMRPVFRNPKAYGLTPNTCPNLPRNFNPTEPTVKSLKAKIVEGLWA
jgi:hypothetical protein